MYKKKHVFYVHSHITYYISMAIINEIKISESEVLFIKSRAYENNSLDNSKCIDITDIHDSIDKIGKLDFFKTYKYIKKIDNLIDSKIPNIDFSVYLPMVRHKAMQIIASNKNCKQINIIEEGVIAYSKYFMHFKEKNVLLAIGKYIVNNFLNIGRGRFYFIKPFDIRKFIKKNQPIFYTVSNQGFKGLPFKIKKIELISDKNFSFELKGNIVMVLEGAVEQGNLGLETFISSIEEMLRVNTQNEKKISIKFHPAQSDANKEKIINSCKKLGIKPQNIPNHVSFEQLALKNKNLLVIGFSTSLLFYARELGCKVISYEYLLIKDPLFIKYRAENNFDLQNLLKN